jgi:SAM-dependent methyltransferase
MLEVVRAKAAAEALPVACLQANLCHLTCLPDAVFGYAVSLFSTLGMVRGPTMRQRALAESARILRPGGRLALHVHNIWVNARTNEGRGWMLRQAIKAWRGDEGAGDRRMLYRGIPGMEVHLYRWKELRTSLEHAGLSIDEVLSLDAMTADPIRHPWLIGRVRAGGWIVFARKR